LAIAQHMHEGIVCCAVWKDKQAVRLLSMHAEPISRPGCKAFVYRKIGRKRKKVLTGPIHLQYTRNMKGVDAVDQLRGTYSCIKRSHKWWHRLFSYLLDTTISNMWQGCHGDGRTVTSNKALVHPLRNIQAYSSIF
jgi:hypothetical protein